LNWGDVPINKAYNRANLTNTAKLRYIELRYFGLPVLLNNGKWPGYNQCK